MRVHSLSKHTNICRCITNYVLVILFTRFFNIISVFHYAFVPYLYEFSYSASKEFFRNLATTFAWLFSLFHYLEIIIHIKQILMELRCGSPMVPNQDCRLDMVRVSSLSDCILWPLNIICDHYPKTVSSTLFAEDCFFNFFSLLEIRQVSTVCSVFLILVHNHASMSHCRLLFD